MRTEPNNPPTTADLIKRLGGAPFITRRLGLTTRGAVNHWRAAGARIPSTHFFALRALAAEVAPEINVGRELFSFSQLVEPSKGPEDVAA